MKGSYWFKAKSKKVLFEFSIRRNITIIKGDSATGKTTLLRILYEYLRIGRQSGYAVSTNASYYVYIRDEVGRDWKDALYPLKNTVIFIEENNEFVFTKEFASYVKESGNYFVFVTRAPLKMLPYSIHEIYEIITDGKRTDIKESYHEFKEIYSNYPIIENNKIQNVVTEDSNSGYQFFEHVCKDNGLECETLNGNIQLLLPENTGMKIDGISKRGKIFSDIEGLSIKEKPGNVQNITGILGEKPFQNVRISTINGDISLK